VEVVAGALDAAAALEVPHRSSTAPRERAIARAGGALRDRLRRRASAARAGSRERRAVPRASALRARRGAADRVLPYRRGGGSAKRRALRAGRSGELAIGDRRAGAGRRIRRRSVARVVSTWSVVAVRRVVA